MLAGSPKPARVRRCLTTGRPLPERPVGAKGPPPDYLNQDARNVNAWLSGLDGAIQRLARDPGFTPAARRALRRRLFDLVNGGPLRPERDRDFVGEP